MRGVQLTLKSSGCTSVVTRQTYLRDLSRNSPPDKRPRMDGGGSDDKQKAEVEVVMSAKEKRKAEAAGSHARVWCL